MERDKSPAHTATVTGLFKQAMNAEGKDHYELIVKDTVSGEATVTEYPL